MSKRMAKSPGCTRASTSSRQRARSWPYPRQQDYRKQLEQAAETWFVARRCSLQAKKRYALANRRHWPRNIIDARVVRAIQAQPLGLHRDIHSGLSSQAMVFNLIGPLWVGGDLAVLHEVLIREGLSCPQGAVAAEWEHRDRSVLNEYSGPPTSIDLVMRELNGQPRIFLEAKLSETGFGGCSRFTNGECDGRNPTQDFNLCYFHYVGCRYWELLKEYGFLGGPMGTDSTCVLASHYQFFRELLFAVHQGGTFVLLSDERSPTFHTQGPTCSRGLMPFLTGLVPRPLRSSIGSVSVQQVVQAIKRSGRHPWIREFEKKYALA